MKGVGNIHVKVKRQVETGDQFFFKLPRPLAYVPCYSCVFFCARGHAMHTLFVDGLDALIAQIADRGLGPAKRETYSNGVRKITYRDADGNEIGFGGAPQ
jgi:hypothetical protein